ncbi:MAG: hypothetical protein RR572_02570, partial [Raoultibacter sp.]
ELFASTQANNWTEFQAKLFKNMAHMLSEGNKLDADTKKFIFHTLSQAVSIFKKATTQRLLPTPDKDLIFRKERYRPKG